MLRSLGPSGFAEPPYGPTLVLRPSLPINPRSITTATVKAVSSPASRAVVKVSVALYAQPGQFLQKREGRIRLSKSGDGESAQLVRCTVPVLCIWFKPRDFDVVVVYAGGRIGGRVSGGDIGESGRGLAIPDLGSIELGVSAPANHHTGRASKGEVLL